MALLKYNCDMREKRRVVVKSAGTYYESFVENAGPFFNKIKDRLAEAFPKRKVSKKTETQRENKTSEKTVEAARKTKAPEKALKVVKKKQGTEDVRPCQDAKSGQGPCSK